MSEGLMVAYAASPTPTSARASRKLTNPVARAAPAVASDQSATPAAISAFRDHRSARVPKRGLVSMYTITNAVSGRLEVGQGAEEGAREHVHDHERGEREAGLGIGEVQLALEKVLDRARHVAVYVVEQVHRREDDDGEAGAGGGQCRFLHLPIPGRAVLGSL